jgi:hypothetical protein
MKPVHSSAVKAVGYDPAAQEMHVQFHSGDTIYTYPGVKPEQHQQLMASKSIGAHLAKHFKGKKAA